MDDFFKPWRRTIGLVMLVMACVTSAGWVRSMTFYESVSIQFREAWSEELASFDSSLVWTATKTSVPSGLVPEFFSERRPGEGGVWNRPAIQ